MASELVGGISGSNCSTGHIRAFGRTGRFQESLNQGPIRSMQGEIFRQYKVISQDSIALKVREKEKS